LELSIAMARGKCRLGCDQVQKRTMAAWLSSMVRPC
jgi:hypothetical protein